MTCFLHLSITYYLTSRESKPTKKPYLSRLSCSLVLLPPPLLDLLPEATLTATTVVWEMELALITFVRLVGVGGPLNVVSVGKKQNIFIWIGFMTAAIVFKYEWKNEKVSHEIRTVQWFSTFGSWRPTKQNKTQFGDPFTTKILL